MVRTQEIGFYLIIIMIYILRIAIPIIILRQGGVFLINDPFFGQIPLVQGITLVGMAISIIIVEALFSYLIIPGIKKVRNKNKKYMKN